MAIKHVLRVQATEQKAWLATAPPCRPAHSLMTRLLVASFSVFATGSLLMAQAMTSSQKSLEWHRQLMGGSLSATFMQNQVMESFKYQSYGMTRSALPSASPAWKCIGPVSANYAQDGVTLNRVDSGRVSKILIDTSDDSGNTVYVLTAGGGLWKTTTFRQASPAWQPLSDYVGSTSGGAVAQGGNPSVLYLGLGDPFDMGVGGYIVVSNTGGMSWDAPQFLGSATQVLDIQVEKSGAEDLVLVGTDAGLFRSIGGTNFQAAGTESLAGKKVWGLVKTSQGWLASVQSNSTGSSGSLFISNNQGVSWTALPALGNNAGRISLSVGRPGDATVYAYAAATTNMQLDLYRSNDGGRTWTALGLASKKPTNASAENPDMQLMRQQAGYNQMVVVDPQDNQRNTVYIGGQYGVAKSSDGGNTWQLISSSQEQNGLPYVHAGLRCGTLAYVGGEARLVIGTDGGIFTSSDGGNSFDDKKNNGLISHLLYSLATYPKAPESLLIGTQGTGTRVREGTSGIFNQVKGGSGVGVAWSQAGNSVALYAGACSAIFVSADASPNNQNKWSAFQNGLTNVGSLLYSYYVSPIAAAPAMADPNGQTFFHASKVKIFRTTNAGKNNPSWGTIGTAGSNGLPSGVLSRAGSHVISCSPLSIDCIAVAGMNNQVFITKNAGANWTIADLGSQVPGWAENNASIGWANNQMLYVCSEGQTTNTASIRVAKSTDGGTTWSAAGSAQSGLPNVPISKVVVSPSDASGNTVFAATWLGVYVTENGGSSWRLYGQGLPHARITDLYLPPDGSYLRVATWGRGVWETSLSTLVDSPAVALRPTSATLAPGASMTFQGSATVGTITYSATGGTINAQGLYVAGNTPGNYTVTATSAQDSSKFATSQVVITQPQSSIAVSIQPTTSSVTCGNSVQFTAAVTGTTNTAVTWKATGGTISANGLFVAGNTPGNYSVTATSVADNSRSASATISIVQAVAVNITPNVANADPGKTVQFTATVTGSTNTTVSWSATAGTVTSTGLYTAPTAPGIYTVRATSNADSSRFAESTVTVKALVAALLITSQPQSVTVTEGSRASFAVSVSGGTSPYSCQWYKNGVSLTGATSLTCEFNTAIADNNSTIYAVVQDSAQQVATSNTATLTVQGAPVITVGINPATASTQPGKSVQFTATVSGSNNTSVTWSATSGTVSSAGLYTAPATPGTYKVRATSVANASQYAESTVTVGNGTIYYGMNNGYIGKVDQDGQTRQNDNYIFTDTTKMSAIAVNSTHVYWVETANQRIRRVDMNGNATTVVRLTKPDCYGLVLDDNYLYWASSSTVASDGPSIGRAKLDGSQSQPQWINCPNSSPYGLALDGTYIYWADYPRSQIGRAKLDGSSVTASFISCPYPNGPQNVQVDGNYLYWSSPDTSKIGRAKVDGSNVNLNWISAINGCAAIYVNGYIYCASPSSPSMDRVNIDGTNYRKGFCTMASRNSTGLVVR